MNVSVHVCECVCWCGFICVSVSVYMNVNIHVYMCVHVWMCVCSCECTFMCLSVYVSKHSMCDICDYVMWVCAHVCGCKCEYVIVGMFVYVFLTVFMFLPACVLGKLDINLTCPSLDAVHLDFWGQGFLLGPNSPTRLDKLAKKSQRSSCLCLPSGRLTTTSQHR